MHEPVAKSDDRIVQSSFWCLWTINGQGYTKYLIDDVQHISQNNKITQALIVKWYMRLKAWNIDSSATLWVIGPGATTQAYELLKFLTFITYSSSGPHTRVSDVIKQKFLTSVVQSKWQNLFKFFPEFSWLLPQHSILHYIRFSSIYWQGKSVAQTRIVSSGVGSVKYSYSDIDGLQCLRKELLWTFPDKCYNGVVRGNTVKILQGVAEITVHWLAWSMSIWIRLCLTVLLFSWLVGVHIIGHVDHSSGT